MSRDIVDTLTLWEVRPTVEPFIHLLHHRAAVAQPYRACQHKDVRCQHLLEDGRPIVARPPMFAHVRPYPSGDVMVDWPYHLDAHSVFFHDGGADFDQALGVADLRRALQRAVELQRPQSRE